LGEYSRCRSNQIRKDLPSLLGTRFSNKDTSQDVRCAPKETTIAPLARTPVG
jgi:hypothetical protein